MTSISERESIGTEQSLSKLKKSRHQKNHSETSFILNMVGASAAHLQNQTSSGGYPAERSAISTHTSMNFSIQQSGPNQATKDDDEASLDFSPRAVLPVSYTGSSADSDAH